MELLAPALTLFGKGLAETGKCLCGSIYPKIKSIIRFQSSLANLRKEVETLLYLKNTVKEWIEAAERDGYPLTLSVTEWIREVEKIEDDVNSLQSGMMAYRESVCKGCPNCFLRCNLGVEVAKNHIEVKQLIKAGSSISGLVVKNHPVKKVEHIPGPSIEGQSTSSNNLAKVLHYLYDDGMRRIGVWGMGGVGKTTLVKNLNNKLETSSTTQPFSVIIWVTVSKELDLKRIQTQIAVRLNLGVRTGESMETTASRIHQRLMKEEKFLLILDDVWKKIDLDSVGVPRPENHKGCKLILTSRFLDVCRQMKTDAQVQVDTLNDEESWQLFAQNAGDVVSLQHIEPLAKAVCRECCRLPLAITTVEASMRGKRMIEQWKDALNALRSSMPMPHINEIEDDVYKPLKWSYDSLQGMVIKSCFLYCCLYPEDDSIKARELVQCWVAEGLTDELPTYEDSINRGIAMVENLKDCCLLEHGDFEGTVKMHDVVRDVALRIATSGEDGCKSLVRSGISLNDISEVSLLKSLKRLSFMDSELRMLSESVMQCPAASTLLLKGDFHPAEVPGGLLLGFPVLRVLNLSGSSITALPLTLNQLGELRALLLHGCIHLTKLPRVGGLRNLQVLDCSHTSIRELPEGMEELINLRHLDLSGTRDIQIIPVGIVSRLSRLEVIDMTNTTYQWTVTEKGPWEELRCLDQLIGLYIHLLPVLLTSYDFAWIKRLKRFRFVIGKTGTFWPKLGKYNERNLTFCRTRHYERWIEYLLNNADSLLFEGCCLKDFPTSLAKDSCFHGLKSLHISNSKSRFERAGGSAARLDLVPNLEELHVHGMDNLESISELGGHLGLGFSKLRVIEVFHCNSLNYLLSFDGVIPSFKNLEVVSVRTCESLEELFNYCNCPDRIVPNLQIVKLHCLPRLQTLCRQEDSWQCLEQLEVLECELIKKLPLTTQNANSIKEIRGEPKWWSQLEWDAEHTKSSLQQCFTPYTFGHLVADEFIKAHKFLLKK